MMKNIFRLIIISGLMGLLVTACSKEEIPVYSGPNGVNLLAKIDDMSFRAYAPEVLDYTFYVNVNLISVSSSATRTIEFELDPEKTTAKINDDFEMPLSITIAAGEVSTILPVKVFKKNLEGLEEALIIGILVKQSNEFVHGMIPYADLSFSGLFPREWFISEGTNNFWLTYNLGRCTTAKYTFVYEYLGTIDLLPWNNMWPSIDLQTELNDKIAAYNAGKPESEWLKDIDADGNEKNLQFGAND